MEEEVKCVNYLGKNYSSIEELLRQLESERLLNQLGAECLSELELQKLRLKAIKNNAEYIELGPVTKEDIERVREMNPVLEIEDLPKIKDLNDKETMKAIELSDDLRAIIHYENMALVLEYVKKQLQCLSICQFVDWDNGRLAINGVRTKLKVGEGLKAIEHLTKFCSHERASEIVAQLWIEKIKELF